MFKKRLAQNIRPELYTYCQQRNCQIHRSLICKITTLSGALRTCYTRVLIAVNNVDMPPISVTARTAVLAKRRQVAPART